MNVEPVRRWYVGKEQNYTRTLSARRPKSKSVWKWLSVLASSFPFPRHYPSNDPITNDDDDDDAYWWTHQ